MSFHSLEESKFPHTRAVEKFLPPIPPAASDLDDKQDVEIPREIPLKIAEPRATNLQIAFYPKLPTIILESNLSFKNTQPIFDNLNFENNNLAKFNDTFPIINNISELEPKPIASFTKQKNEHLTRKIVKNFGKAIASFACSSKALFIINKMLKNDAEKRQKFVSFVYENKELIEGNRRLMQLLTINEEDHLDLKRNKKIFKILAEIFMKKYVQQWLWNSKLVNKELHATLIKDMRRRITNPELLEHLSE